MSTHYLIDAHTTPVLNSDINDVRFSSVGESVLNGNFVVRLPDGVSIGITPPTGLTDLLTKKYAGLLAFYAGFTRITFDDLLDAADMDPPACTGANLGDRGTVSIYPGGVLQTDAIPLTGAAPPEAITTWEASTRNYVDAGGAPIQAVYQEQDPTALMTCDVSFNGGTNFNTVTDGQYFNVPVPHQGTSLVIRWTNTSSSRVYVTSWAVIY